MLATIITLSPKSKIDTPIRMKCVFLASMFVLMTSIMHAQEESPLYKNPEAGIEARVDDLISRMTLLEKVGQMTQLNITMLNTSGRQKDVKLVESKARELFREWQIGSILNGEAAPAQQWYDYMDQLTHIAMEESRLDIPIIYGIDHIHGASYMSNTVLFPQAITLANSFNPELAYQEGKITVVESADVGHHWIFAPVLDLGRTPLFPRFWETYGEDPYLAARMGEAFVKGIQDPHEEIAPYKIAACAKHFIGYSDPYSGWDRTPVDLSMQTIHEFYRPSFQAAVDAGLKTVMVNSGEVNGIPVHGSAELLTKLLREQMGFDGVILTDWADIEKMINYHYVAHDWKEATLRAINAGIDMSMTPSSLKFNEALIELVEEGKVSEARIDSSVARILRLKFELGLFEHPYPRNDRFDRIGSEEHKAVSLQAAEEGIVLLRNENKVLPLSKETKEIILLGPSVRSKTNLNGGWTLKWQGGGANENFPEWVKTVEDAISAAFPDTKVTYIEHIEQEGRSAKKQQKQLSSADAIIYVGGEEPYTEFRGNITDLSLEQKQLDEIAYVSKFTDKLILVLVEGRPRLITEIFNDTEAIIFAGLPGFLGADAIANIISGDVNPSGKLSFSYPLFPNHHIAYNHKPGAINYYTSDEANAIEVGEGKRISLFPFGYGLSYTSFEYSDLRLSSESMNEDEIITAEITVQNTGDLAGQESVLWFLRDKVGYITRPVSLLKYFEKIELEPGESKTLRFEIDSDDLWYPDENGAQRLEAGEFILKVGGLSKSFILNESLKQ